MNERKDVLEKVVNALKGCTENVYRIDSGITIKNNGVERRFVCIHDPNVNIAPVIYVDSWLQEYMEGKTTIDKIVQSILTVYVENACGEDFNIREFGNFESVAHLIQARLVNTKENREYLNTVPNRTFLDLSIVYSVELPEDGGKSASIRISNEHIKMWNISEETLFELSLVNMNGNIVCSSLVDILGVSCLKNRFDIDECPIDMYVLTNRKKFHGAVEIIDKEILKEIACKLDSDYIIIPSSIHETIIIPIYGRYVDWAFYVNMVREVNKTCVTKEEFLSNHIYKYTRQEEKIIIAA